MSGRIDPVARRAWPSKPIERVVGVKRHDPREEQDREREPPPRRDPPDPAPPDDGRAHIDVRA